MINLTSGEWASLKQDIRTILKGDEDHPHYDDACERLSKIVGGLENDLDSYVASIENQTKGN